jgi:hypothetical protein
VSRTGCHSRDSGLTSLFAPARARAEDVLLMLGLNDCANVLVGGALVKGASGRYSNSGRPKAYLTHTHQFVQASRAARSADCRSRCR